MTALRFLFLSQTTLEKLKRTVIENGNVFAEVMNTARVCSLRRITKALFEVGAEHR